MFVKINLEYTRRTGLSPCFTVALHAGTRCSTAIASLPLCSAMSPTTCQSVPVSWCDARVRAGSGQRQSPAGRPAPGSSRPIPSHPIPSHPTPGRSASDKGKAQIQPSLVTCRFLEQSSRKHFHVALRGLVTSPFSQPDILLPTVGAEGRP